MDFKDYQDFLLEELIPADKLQARIAELGADISRDYQGEELLLVCILRGGVMFLTDLMRHITVPHTIDFMAISSYGSGARQSSGSVRITMDLRSDIAGRNVLLVEDIIDSGRTIASMLELLESRHPASLKVCTLLDKSSRREVEVPIDYLGFTIPDVWVVGYGLDFAERHRTWPFIAELSQEKLDQ